MTEVRFDEADVTGLQARLEGLDLTTGERAALDHLVALAGESAVEVAGFASRTAVLGDLTGFLSSGHTTGSSATGFLSSGHTTGSSATGTGTRGRGTEGITKSGGGNSI